MPMSVSQSQAHESPLVRIRIRSAQGALHQVTISSSLRPSAEQLESEAYQHALQAAVHRFFEGMPLTVVRIEHLSQSTVEIGQ